MPTNPKPRGEEVTEILELLTQVYFERIAQEISYGDRIAKQDQQIIRSVLGPITYNEFVAYTESTGVYSFDD